ncbi:Putative glutamine amidotransferasec [Legionella massiliensis]|uniref:Putative glutamine amidotransferasec n=1 Tax=Legionella massiliensis TaxID=1034943 RepID=A0A078KRS9_9GAMM|nr:gamma-glutamyl-gamma-aminobutyrate hydrolase family protein [Legionella massiliensis]CDZ77140.1 Putative glutamine amidotransferasec [Legionella massiliensis]CEE12878.1 Putative glutamine amidotransferase [Legionella massiliensis]
MPILTQTELQQLLDDIAEAKKNTPPGSKFPLANYLKAKNYSPILQDLDFASEKTVKMTQLQRADGSLSSLTTVPRRTDLLTNIDFSGCELSNCNFNECDLTGSVFYDQIIHNSSFNNAVLNHSSMQNVQFREGQFNHCSFAYSELAQVHFADSLFLHTNLNYLKQFAQVNFDNCFIERTSMLGGAKDASFEQNYGKNKVALILLCWNDRVPLMSATLAEKMLLERGMSSVRMDIMAEVDASQLDQEINQLNLLTKNRIQQLKDEVLHKAQKRAKNEQDAAALFAEEWKKQGISFPLLMIQLMREENEKNTAAFPQMNALYQHAKAVFDKVDGIMLTGGQDMDPRFYGEERHPKTGLPTYADHPELSDPRRDVLEFSLVYMQQRASAPKPLCGICRGSQVIAASYGATIYQELDSPERRQYFVETLQPKEVKPTAPLHSTSRHLVATADKEVLSAIFMHHQGYDLTKAHGLEATASTQTSGGKMIDVVGENLAQNVTLVQAHLEYYVDKEEGTQRGFAPHMSANAADAVFQQFQTRVLAYRNSQVFSHSKSAGFFTTSSTTTDEDDNTPSVESQP